LSQAGQVASFMKDSWLVKRDEKSY